MVSFSFFDGNRQNMHKRKNSQLYILCNKFLVNPYEAHTVLYIVHNNRNLSIISNPVSMWSLQHWK